MTNPAFSFPSSKVWSQIWTFHGIVTGRSRLTLWHETPLEDDKRVQKTCGVILSCKHVRYTWLRDQHTHARQTIKKENAKSHLAPCILIGPTIHSIPWPQSHDTALSSLPTTLAKRPLPHQIHSPIVGNKATENSCLRTQCASRYMTFSFIPCTVLFRTTILPDLAAQLSPCPHTLTTALLPQKYGFYISHHRASTICRGPEDLLQNSYIFDNEDYEGNDAHLALKSKDIFCSVGLVH